MRDTELYVRITAGSLKGKKISLPSKGTTRSTKSIVKSSFFDTVQHELMDELFVEVFGGSGSVGLEAISRGVKHAYFIEKDRDSFQTLQDNIHALGVQNEATALMGDSFERFPLLLSTLEKEKTQVYFYVDPPFSIREGMEDIYEKTLSLIGAIPPSMAKLIVIEHDSQVAFPQEIGAFKLVKTRKFGRTSLTHYLP